MHNKSGQGLSLNTIIIAVLALIVLVVLVMIFTGRIAIFEREVSREGQSELVKMRIQYGECRPGTVQENSFLASYTKAESSEDKELTKATFKEEIDRCRGSSTKDNCQSAGCNWG